MNSKYVAKYFFIFYVIILFVIPLFLFVSLSFHSFENYAITKTLTLDNYHKIFTSGAYLHSIVNSFVIAFVSLLVVALSSGFALYLRFYVNKKYRELLLILVILPLLTNFIIKIFSWRIILSESGIINRILMGSNLISSPINFLYNPSIIVFGLATYILPFAIFIMYDSLSNIPDIDIVIAKQLGADDGQIFSNVIFPNVRNSMVMVVIVAFILSIGDFIVATLLGGSKVYLVSLQLIDIMRINSVPLASALGAFLMVVLLIVIFFINKLRIPNE